MRGGPELIEPTTTDSPKASPQSTKGLQSSAYERALWWPPLQPPTVSCRLLLFTALSPSERLSGDVLQPTTSRRSAQSNRAATRKRREINKADEPTAAIPDAKNIRRAPHGGDSGRSLPIKCCCRCSAIAKRLVQRARSWRSTNREIPNLHAQNREFCYRIGSVEHTLASSHLTRATREVNLIRRNELLDYFRNKTGCRVLPPANGHFLVYCGACSVVIPDDEQLTTTTANEIERRLEPCLGRNWMP